jgi:hypothetical protein
MDKLNGTVLQNAEKFPVDMQMRHGVAEYEVGDRDRAVHRSGYEDSAQLGWDTE